MFSCQQMVGNQCSTSLPAFCSQIWVCFHRVYVWERGQKNYCVRDALILIFRQSERRAWERTILPTGSVFQKQGQGIGPGRNSAGEDYKSQYIYFSNLVARTKLPILYLPSPLCQNLCLTGICMLVARQFIIGQQLFSVQAHVAIINIK